MRPGLYLENPEFRMARVYVSDAVYAAAIASFPVLCADVLFIQRAKQLIYLPSRCIKPMPSRWLIGGRIFAGELETEAACRHVKHDTNLSITPERFEFIMMNRYIWTERQQEPQHVGSDSVAYTFALDISDEELAVARTCLNPAEYDSELGIAAFNRLELKTEGVHSEIRRLYETVFPA